MRTLTCFLLLLAATAAGCTRDGSSGSAGEGLTGAIRIDGSSTVYPLSFAAAEDFRKVEPGVRPTVASSGTGGGFKKFARAETDISNASRPIKAGETEQAAQNNVQYIELPMAFDGLTVVVHKDNAFVDHLTAEELKRIWQPGSTVKTWQDVRPEWPAEDIQLYGPGADSGTFDYFTEAINHESKASRRDFTASEDDNVLVTGVAGDLHALGYFGYAYYKENQARLRAVPIDGGAGPVAPSEETVNDGTYAPLSRPVFIYVSQQSAQRPEVQAFVRYYVKEAARLARDVGYIPLPAAAYELVLKRFEQQKTGSIFHDAKPGVDIEELLRRSM